LIRKVCLRNGSNGLDKLLGDLLWLAHREREQVVTDIGLRPLISHNNLLLASLLNRPIAVDVVLKVDGCHLLKARIRVGLG
jgi:hypothetical protein